MIIFVHFYFPFSVHCYIIIYTKAYKDISYKIYDDIDIYKTINSYEQVFDNIEAVNYYKDIYNQIIFEYKIN